MKKVMMLAIMVLGTTAMVNAQNTPVKASETKEVKMGKHKKHHKKEAGKMQATKTESKKPEATTK